MSDTSDSSFSINQSQLPQSNVAAFNQVGRDLNQTVNVFTGVPLTETLQQLLYHHESATIFANRLDSFVGREGEIGEIRATIAQVMPTGGYVTITAQAGEGKSSVIARMVSQDGPDQTAFHFIALTPGREYQLSLLRPIVARLVLKHGLPTTYFPDTSYPAMRDYFHSVLRQLSEQGIQEVIYLDGLDQLEAEAGGTRDLSFLPNSPPPGIVLVLGTRPDDTLQPLDGKKVQVEYRLPHLGYPDFQQLLAERRAVTEAAHRLYTALQGNAFYLALIVQELKAGPIADFDVFIQQISDNPDNLFGFTIKRLRQDKSFWKDTLLPVITLLLVAQEPLGIAVLRHLLDAEDDDVRTGLQRLGGFVAQDSQHRFFHYHLKVRDYLAEDPDDADAPFVVSQAQILAMHTTLADWCIQNTKDSERIWTDSTGLEQTRRWYARHHYGTHLMLGQQWDRVCQVIDAGTYGRHKRRFDPSTQLYALDLDRARDMAVTRDDLASLWRWSLLRTTLASRMDQWPESLFLALVTFGRSAEALARIELVTDAARRITLLSAIAPHLPAADAVMVWQRARAIANTISNEFDRASALASLATAFAAAGDLGNARMVADTIPHDFARSGALANIAAALHQAGRPEATETFQTARTIADAIPHAFFRSSALADIAAALVTTGDLEAARTTALAIPSDPARSKALANIAAALVTAGDLEAARAIAAILVDHARSHALGEIAQALVCAGDLEAARTTALAIPHDFARSSALAAIAAALVRAGDLEAARAAANDIPNDRNRSSSLAEIAIVLRQVGHPQATAVFQTACAIADTISDAATPLSALANIAAALHQAGHPEATETFQTARALADAIPNVGYRSGALADIAAALVRAGDLEAARAITNTIPNDPARSKALAEIAAALVTTGDLEAARALADTIPNVGYRSGALANIATALHNAGHPAATATFQTARATANTIPVDRNRSSALADIATALVRAGDLETARTVTCTIPDVGYQSSALADIAAALHNAGHPAATATFAAARVLADTIPDVGYRSYALAGIAAALVRAGELEIARVLADSIPIDLARSKALAAIAHVHCTAGDLTAARTTADAISDTALRSSTLGVIATALHNAGDPAVVALVSQTWRVATTRNTLLALIPIAFPLLRDDPTFGLALRDAFTWVDNQLREEVT